MDYSLIQTVAGVIVSGVSMFIIPAARGMYVRVNNLEREMLTKITDAQARQLLQDKIDPVHVDLKEIKEQLNQIINRLIDSNGKQ